MSGLEDFRRHYEGSRIPQPPITDEAFLNNYRNRLPDPLLEEWQASGFSGFANGFIWLTDPGQMEYAISEWQVDPPAQIFGRTAFGDLFMWDGENVHCLFVHEGTINWLTDDLKMFFEYSLCDESFLEDVLRFGLFPPALAKLGPVASDEIYTFVPALVLGGNEDTDHLKKVKMREQLLFLSQAHHGARST